MQWRLSFRILDKLFWVCFDLIPATVIGSQYAINQPKEERCNNAEKWNVNVRFHYKFYNVTVLDVWESFVQKIPNFINLLCYFCTSIDLQEGPLKKED